jgi:hypothetical protein
MPVGKYYVNSRPATAGKLVGNKQLRQQLWSRCCEYCELPLETVAEY